MTYLRNLIIAIAVLGSGIAHSVEFNQVLHDKSNVSFAYKQMNVPLDGKFSKFNVRLVFDPAKVAAASAQIDIDLASIDTGSAEGNDEVSGKLWFNTKTFPSAKFVSSGVKALGGNKYEVVGKLTIKGKTLDATAPFTFKQDAANGVFEGVFTLKRLDFAIGEGIWADVSAVANEIQIKFKVVAGSAPGKK